jgi:ABC-type multidrug transport system fused ATPase/permease subunit
MWSLFIGTSLYRVSVSDHAANNPLICSGCMPQFMPAALTFAVFAVISAASHDKSLLVAQAFTSLSLISLLTYPLNQLVQAAPQLLACAACFGRIGEFLDQPGKDSVCELGTEQSLQTYPRDALDDEQYDQNEKAYISCATSAVDIRHASFAWSSSAGPVLHDINLQIPMHSIEMLCGPIGSGKSTLIHGILGNALRVTGSLRVTNGSLSYCGQTPWLMSGTIRDNIIAGSDFDEEWYRYTLWACSLDRDLGHLSGGELTEVGSNGNVLSGGQKQRIVSCSSQIRSGP